MKNLKIIREKSNLSQAQLAKMLHLSQQTICKYEKGESEASFATLVQLSSIFTIPISYLVDDSLDFDDLDKYDMSESEQEKLLLSYFRNLSPSSKDSILSICKDLCMQVMANNQNKK